MMNPGVQTVETYQDRKILAFLGFAGPIISALLAASQGDLLAGTILGQNDEDSYEKYVAAAAASLITGVVDDNNAIIWTAVTAGADGNDITIAFVDPKTPSAALSVSVSGTDITINLATTGGAYASGASGVEGSNNGLTWTSKLVGVLGNDNLVVLQDPGAVSQDLAITVNGNNIIVSLATDESGGITTTAAQVIAAIEADEDANALVGVEDTGESTGAVAVTDEIVSLANGEDATPSSTAAEVLIAVAADESAAALVSGDDYGDSTGEGTVTAAAEASLANGVDINVIPAVILNENVLDQSAAVNVEAYLGGVFHTNMLVGMDAYAKTVLGARVVGTVTIVPV